MPWMIGDYEKHLAKLGVIVATAQGRNWRCWMCEKGKLILTRALNDQGALSEARFICDACGDDVGIYPDKGGGVQPALKGINKMKTERSSAGTGHPGEGMWR